MQRCLDAMNGCDSASLAEAQQHQRGRQHRNVGLVIETRPDWITADEVRRLRRLGVTKVQLGVQSLDDEILAPQPARPRRRRPRAGPLRLLRLAGFKIHLHWMPNLLGATPESDLADFQPPLGRSRPAPGRAQDLPHGGAGRHRALCTTGSAATTTPTTGELIDLIGACKQTVPRYCRLTRIIRDIPAADIVAGNKQSNLRQVVQQEMRRRGLRCRCIRCREVGQAKAGLETTVLTIEVYHTTVAEEHFLSYVTPADRLAAFLRLSLPYDHQASADLFPELSACAMIREVHVYGPALDIGSASEGEAQHSGLGTRLIEEAEDHRSPERLCRPGRDRCHRHPQLLSPLRLRSQRRVHGQEPMRG